MLGKDQVKPCLWATFFKISWLGGQFYAIHWGGGGVPHWDLPPKIWLLVVIIIKLMSKVNAHNLFLILQ